MTMTIRAQIVGETCSALGFKARGVFALCRKLVEATLIDPATPLEAYRGDMLCLRVTSIGWGARHTVSETAISGPRLARWKPDLRWDSVSRARVALPAR